MRRFEIRKRSGGTRVIYAPAAAEMQAYRDILARLPAPPDGPSHAFRAGRSIVSNAAIHVGRRETVSMDLSGFFDSVRPAMLRGRVAGDVLARCLLAEDGTPMGELPDGDPRRETCAPRQGLPTSPRLADLAAGPLDKAIRKLLQKMQQAGKPVSLEWYSRYADDLAVSHDGDRVLSRHIAERVGEAVRRCGFRMNPHKTRYQSAGTEAHPQRREVCGLTVDDGVHTPRKFRRRLRAALHQARRTEYAADERRMRQVAAGMAAHAACVPPRDPEQIRARELAQGEAAAQRAAAKIGLAKIDWAGAMSAKVLGPGPIDGGVELSTDPLDWIRMGTGLRQHGTSSAFSCMGPQGSYRHGIVWWAQLPGAGLAILRGPHGRIEARAIVLAMREGGRRRLTEYARGPAASQQLVAALDAAGWSALARGIVVGHVPKGTARPYFDAGDVEVVKLKDSNRSVERLRV